MADTSPKADADQPIGWDSSGQTNPTPPKMHSFSAKFPDASGITNPPAPKC